MKNKIKKCNYNELFPKSERLIELEAKCDFGNPDLSTYELIKNLTHEEIVEINNLHSERNSLIYGKFKEINNEYLQECKTISETRNEKCGSCFNCKKTYSRMSHSEKFKCTVGYTPRENGYCKAYKEGI